METNCTVMLLFVDMRTYESFSLLPSADFIPLNKRRWKISSFPFCFSSVSDPRSHCCFDCFSITHDSSSKPVISQNQPFIPFLSWIRPPTSIILLFVGLMASQPVNLTHLCCDSGGVTYSWLLIFTCLMLSVEAKGRRTTSFWEEKEQRLSCSGCVY